MCVFVTMSSDWGLWPEEWRSASKQTNLKSVSRFSTGLGNVMNQYEAVWWHIQLPFFSPDLIFFFPTRKCISVVRNGLFFLVTCSDWCNPSNSRHKGGTGISSRVHFKLAPSLPKIRIHLDKDEVMTEDEWMIVRWTYDNALHDQTEWLSKHYLGCFWNCWS